MTKQFVDTHSRIYQRCFARSFTIAAALSLWALPAAAQLGAGTISGRVVDASTHRPVADAVVTASSPALQGEQIVVTDQAGVFQVPNLPPGDYALNVEAETFHPLARPGISLRSGVTLRAELELLPETLAAQEVTVIAKAPTVDVGSARTGLTLSSEFTSRIPVASPLGKGGASRSFEQLAELAPTGRNDTFGASVGGTTSIENVYIIDGMSVKDPGFGYNATPLSIDFIKEANILTGGYLPEYGRGGGGVLEVVTKSGSNEFHGSIFGNATPWQASPKYPPPQDSIYTRPRLDSVRDIGFELGGPIIKDKLWFYLGADYGISSYTLTRDLNSLRVDPDTGKYLRDSQGLIESDRIPGTQRKSLAEQHGGQYLGKLTYSPTDDDRFELIHRGTPTRTGGDGYYEISYATGLPYTAGSPGTVQIGTYDAEVRRRIFDSYGTSLRWTHSALDKHLTFDTTVGWQFQRSADLGADGSIANGGLSGINQFSSSRTNPVHSITDFENIPDPSVCVNPVAGGDPRCPVARYYQGGPFQLSDRKYNTWQGREVATWLVEGFGHHIVKAGFDLELLEFDSLRAAAGGSTFSENSSGTAVTNSPFGWLTAPDTFKQLDSLHYKVSSLSAGAFAQDSWSIMDKVTVNAGFRYDTQQMYAEQGIGLSLPNQWSPRIGFVFDPTQQGRAKIFANYAVYYQSFPLDIMMRGGSSEPNAQSRRSFANCNPGSSTYPDSCSDPNNLVHNPNNPDAATGPNDKWYIAGIGRSPIDPDIKPQSSTEFSGGGEYEIIPNGRLGLTYIHRGVNHIIEDMSRDEGVTLFIGNPGEGIAKDFPKAVRNYDAGILSFTKSFSDDWLAQASYTLAYLRGNWEGLFRAQTNQLDPGANSDFDLRSLLVNRNGSLAGDRRHEIKLFLAKDIKLGRNQRLSFGGAYQARSGAPTNYLGRHILYGTSEVFLLPRGSGDRLPWVHNIDLHVGYTFLQTKTNTLAVTLDIFNLFNFQAVTSTSENYTLRAVEPITGDNAKDPFVNGNRKMIDPAKLTASDISSNPRPWDNTDRNRAFGAASSYQTPTTIRFGVKSTF